jgi:hypothetical protein
MARSASCATCPALPSLLPSPRRNILELAQLTFVLCYLLLRWVFVARSVTEWDAVVRCARTGCFVDLQPMVHLSVSVYNIAAVSSLLSLFKIFKVAWRVLCALGRLREVSAFRHEHSSGLHLCRRWPPFR